MDRSNSTEQKRRIYTPEVKREVAAAALKPGVSIQKLAQAYGVHPSQVFKWRRWYRNELAGKETESVLLPVRLGDGAEHKTARPSPAASNVDQHGIIQIEFPNARVTVPGNADAATVRAVLECLAR
jgi:transposase